MGRGHPLLRVLALPHHRVVVHLALRIHAQGHGLVRAPRTAIARRFDERRGTRTVADRVEIDRLLQDKIVAGRVPATDG